VESQSQPDSKVKIKPSVLVTKLLKLGNRPFSIDDYPYLPAIYNTAAREVGLFTARQVSKSTTLASLAVLEAVVDQPGSNQVIVTPLQDQAYVFSTQRLRDFIHESPIVKEGFFSGASVVDQMLRKVFSNGNTISLGYAQRTADRLRGRSAGRIKFDESQDIQPEVIPVIKEMAFRVQNPSYWYCGTPKTLNNHMEGMRRKSTGNEWAVRCQQAGCGKWNMNWVEGNVGDTGVVCEFCHKDINTDLGQWVSARKLDADQGRDAKITMESFRIPQLIVRPVMRNPIKWRELLDKVRDYPTAQLYNEVFGMPYDSGMQPITLEQLIACCDTNRINRLPDPKAGGIPPLVMGVDWAFVGENSYTFVVIGGWSSFPFKFQVYYWKIFKGQESDSIFQIDWIKETVKKCNIRLVGADWGAGHVQNLQLVNMLGEERVVQLWHTGMNPTPGGSGGGGSGGKNQVRAKWEPKTRKWHLARTAVLTDTFESLRKQQITFPRHKDNDILFQHILAESMEFREQSNRTFYTHVEPDDGLHALTYCMLAGELLIRGNFGGHQGSEATIPQAATAPDIEMDFSDNMY
jgi:hypothetical protein